MSSKRVEIIINDILQELKRENNKLYNQLVFAQKCIKVLEKYRNHLKSFQTKCKCNQKIANELIFHDLENEYKLILNIENESHSHEEIVSAEVEDIEDIGREVEINSSEILVENKTQNKNNLLIFNNKKKCINKDMNNKSKQIENNDYYNEYSDGLESNISDNETESHVIRPQTQSNTVFETKNYDHVISPKDDFINVHNFIGDNDNHVLGDLPIGLKKKNNLVGFRCNYEYECNYGNVSSKEVKAHINKCHLNVMPFKCEFCGISYFGKPALNSHLRTHSAKKYKCDFGDCGYATYNKRRIIEHIKRHNKIKPFACSWPACDSTFVTKHEIEIHLKHRHSEERPFACEWPECKSRFKDKHGLTLHFRTHTGERPFKCIWPGCEQDFTDYSHLKKHKMRHNDEKNYVCSWPQCHKKFAASHHLTVHYRTHTGEKPFKCPMNYCQKGFKERSKLSRHIRIHNTKDEEYYKNKSKTTKNSKTSQISEITSKSEPINSSETNLKLEKNGKSIKKFKVIKKRS